MSIAKAYDVAHVRFRAPDLGMMRKFLVDFGMIEVADGDRVTMRGFDSAPFVHMTERGEPGFVAFGLRVSAAADLEALASHDGTSIQPFDGPGGGLVARLVDPDGYLVEAIADQAMVEPLTVHASKPWNHAGAYPRQSQTRRVPAGASHVRRLGHVVLGVTDFRRSEAWYKERFGFLTSDEIRPGSDVAVGAFLRCDRGNEPSDHHTLFLLERPDAPARFMHAAFEVVDFDDLMAGHDHLVSAGYRHQWGVGRHILGSQVFDYWHDPFDNEIEHWTDGDQFVAADGGSVASISELLGVQWGMAMPESLA